MNSYLSFFPKYSCKSTKTVKSSSLPISILNDKIHFDFYVIDGKQIVGHDNDETGTYIVYCCDFCAEQFYNSQSTQSGECCFVKTHTVFGNNSVLSGIEEPMVVNTDVVSKNALATPGMLTVNISCNIVNAEKNPDQTNN